MSLGTDRVRVSFNPGGNKAVEEVKQLAAQLIDRVEAMKIEGHPELNRMIGIAQTCFEDGAMWAVKACTIP